MSANSVNVWKRITNTNSAMRRLRSCLIFCGASLLGLLISLPFGGIWGIGDCPHRAASLAQSACEAAKTRESWAFLLAVIGNSVFTVRAMRKDAWAGLAAVWSGPLGVVALFVMWILQGAII